MRNIKIWIGVCFLLFAAGIAGMFWNGHGTPGSTVQIIQDGNVLCTVDPSDREERTIEVTYDGRRNLIQIKDGQIRIMEADCPDQICVGMGALQENGMPIVCLPNHLIIQYDAGD